MTHLQAVKEAIVKAVPEIMELKLGCKVLMTKRQNGRFHFSNIPIGTVATVLNKVDLPGYDILVYFKDQYQTLENGERHHSGYLDRGSWKILGRDITLEDCLIAMNEKLGDDTYAVGMHGCTHKTEGQWILHNWQLGKPLHLQSEETIDFLHSLLVTNQS